MINPKGRNLLDGINSPADLKRLRREDLPQLCFELRNFLIESVSRTGGHFGSNLGVVELTVALHYVFDAPRDIIVWDVGHQSYPHKILTGRKDKMNTIRQFGGLAPFVKREESEYDSFSTGHTSTSISAAVGLSIAKKDEKDAPSVIAIIGDGSLAGGMAFEALNHAGDEKLDMLVILNDNEMSISPNVGGLRKHLTQLISSEPYVKMRSKGREFFDTAPRLKEFLMRAESYAKGMVAPGTLFEELGFEYYGPIDGHDPETLVEILGNLKKIKGPKFLHVVTKKGKGYSPAESDEFSLHAVSPFDKRTGKKNGNSKKEPDYTDVFSEWICAKAGEDKDLHAITPAMCSGSGLLKFSREFPGRFHDVGIAEQHALTFAAGLAVSGKKPVVAIYSSFLQRGYDQLIHDIAIQKADVMLAIDRAGIVGPDGATHAGSFDLSFLRCVPNFVIMAPSDNDECFAMLEAGYGYDGPVAVRYPRGGEEENLGHRKNEKIEIGKGEILRRGKDVAILAFGALAARGKNVAEKLGATMVNMRFVKPLDEKIIRELSKDHRYFITIEDNAVSGGAGSAIGEFVLNEKLDVRVKNLGLPDSFLPHGTREEILALAGLSEERILGAIKEFTADILTS